MTEKQKSIVPANIIMYAIVAAAFFAFVILASLYAVQRPQIINPQASSCNEAPVNVQFRMHGATDPNWISGDQMDVKVGDQVDVNCFAKNGAALLGGGHIKVLRGNLPVDGIPYINQGRSISGLTVTQPGLYSFVCENSSKSCSDVDRFSVQTIVSDLDEVESQMSDSPDADVVTAQTAGPTSTSSCSENPVDIQFRVSGQGDTPWIPGNQLQVQQGQQIDINCFSKTGSQLLTNGQIVGDINGDPFPERFLTGIDDRQIRNFTLNWSGTYSFACYNATCKSDVDGITVASTSTEDSPEEGQPDFDKPAQDETDPDQPAETNLQCPRDTFTCEDGSIVTRVGPDCTFAPCSASGEQESAEENPADINGDGNVDYQDLVMFFTFFIEATQSESV